jgi:putative membrane protein
MTDFLFIAYSWIKALHIMAVISWMAGLFYLPRVMVYHVERAETGDVLDVTFQVMESKLLRVIMNPAMIATWFFGGLLVVTPGIVDWAMVWPWLKGGSVLIMTWFHHWLSLRRKDFEMGQNSLTGRQYRLMNEVPTILMIVIVLSVIIKF